MKLPLRALILLSVPILLAADAPQDPGATLTVTRKTTKLRQDKRLFAPAVADLREGDKLVLEQKSGAWLAVQFGPQRGFVHAGDVSDKTDVRLSGQGVRETYSTSETSAAKKGFNPQVEKSYRTQRPDLEAAFVKVDRLQAREVSESELRAFLVEGGLLQEGR